MFLLTVFDFRAANNFHVTTIEAHIHRGAPMKSKKIVRAHIQKLLDAGFSQKEVSEKMDYSTPNNISMLLSDTYPKYLISPNKIPNLQKACGLSDGEVVGLTLARLDDAGDSSVEMTKESFKFFLKAFAHVARDYDESKKGPSATC